jgi:CDGSH-type Zn-finger protein
MAHTALVAWRNLETSREFLQQRPQGHEKPRGQSSRGPSCDRGTHGIIGLRSEDELSIRASKFAGPKSNH